jgi:hypothetical protein
MKSICSPGTRTFFFAATLLLPSCARAQTAPSPSARQCREAAQIVSSGQQDSSGTAWGIVTFCGQEAVEAVATAIRDLKLNPGRRTNINVYSAGMIRRPLVFNAAIQVARDSSIDPLARETALLIIGRQIDPLRVMGLHGGHCTIGWLSEQMESKPVGQLTTEMVRSFFGLTDSISRNISEDQALRDTATCLTSQLSDRKP